MLEILLWVTIEGAGAGAREGGERLWDRLSRLSINPWPSLQNFLMG
jgi:hypothetical protein